VIYVNALWPKRGSSLGSDIGDR